MNDLYWYKESNNYTLIKAVATTDNFGINISGFMKLINAESPYIFYPSLIEEQEVVFPLNKELVLSVEKIKVIKDQIVIV